MVSTNLNPTAFCRSSQRGRDDRGSMSYPCRGTRSLRRVAPKPHPTHLMSYDGGVCEPVSFGYYGGCGVYTGSTHRIGSSSVLPWVTSGEEIGTNGPRRAEGNSKRHREIQPLKIRLCKECDFPLNLIQIPESGNLYPGIIYCDGVRLTSQVGSLINVSKVTICAIVAELDGPPR